MSTLETEQTLVSVFRATISRIQYPTWHKYSAKMYAAMAGTEGDIEAGCERVISPV
jgi:hypothetical protein